MNFDFLSTFVSDVANPLMILIILLVLDFLLGVSRAIREGKFQWKKLGMVVQNGLIKILAWVATALISSLPYDLILDLLGGEVSVMVLQNLGNGAYVLVFIHLISSIGIHLKELGMLPGIQFPPLGKLE